MFGLGKRAGAVVRIGLAIAACAAIGGAAASCSLIVDNNADQCKSDKDCSAFPGRTCVSGVCVPKSCQSSSDCGEGETCKDGVCQPAATCTADNECAAGEKCLNGFCGVAPDCTSNADCQGANYICRKDTKKCVSLVNEQCTTVVGDVKSDEAFIFGSVLPASGDNQATGLAIENSIKLAMKDFTQASNGALPPAPGSTKPRPLVYVGCTDDSNADKAVTAAKYLVEQVGVQAIIGGAYSGVTLKFTNQVTIPAGVLVISPSATSVAITDLPDNGLVWRTSPSDVFQASALTGYADLLESQVRTQLGLTGADKIKVAILYKGDAYGSGLAKALEKTIKINGAPALDVSNTAYYKTLDYGNPDDPATDPLKYDTTVAEMVNNFKPHIIYDFGTDECVEDIFEKIEEQWPTAPDPGYRPAYVFGDGGQIQKLWQYVAGREKMMPLPSGADTLRKRVSGSIPGTDNILFKAFRSAYLSTYTDGTSPDNFGTAGGYDIVYLLSYAAVAAGDKPLTGANLAAGLKKLVPPGTPIDVGSANVNTAFTKLSASTIDFNGASGPLNFDTDTGEAPSDIQIWCLPPNGGPATNSGVYFDAAQNKLIGTTFGAQCN